MDNIPADLFPDSPDGYDYSVEVTGHKHFDSNLAKSFSAHSHKVKFSKNTHAALVGEWNKAKEEGISPEKILERFEPLIAKHNITPFQLQETQKWFTEIQESDNLKVAKIQETAAKIRGTGSGKDTESRAVAIKSCTDDPAFTNAGDERHPAVMKRYNKLFSS